MHASDLAKFGADLRLAFSDQNKGSIVMNIDWKENLSKQITDSLGGAAAEWQILLTNPDLLYDQAVPPEIQQKVQSLLDSYQATMNNIDSMTSTYTKMSKSVGEAMQGDNLKNVGKRIFS